MPIEILSVLAQLKEVKEEINFPKIEKRLIEMNRLVTQSMISQDK
jgi:hypothetical protein